MSDTTDLIARLRQMADGLHDDMSTGAEAADALEQQAAQIAEKDAEIARLHKALDSAYAQAMENGATANALRADAERYRFLKRNGIAVYFRQTQTTNRQIHCQDMDFQIDAALRQEQPAGAQEGPKP